MTKINDLNMQALLPSSIKEDEIIKSIANALDYELKEISAAIDELLIITNIDNLNEEIIDSLAWQFHVDFYEPLGLTLEKKKALVKNALLWHRHKGTKAVIEEMISILFSRPCKVTEWFEYGGKPYFFRLYIDGIQLKMGDFEYILRAVWELKNVRSWLEKLVITKKREQDIFIGTLFLPKYIYKIPFQKTNKVSDINTYVGMAVKEKKKRRISFDENDFNIKRNLETYLGLTVIIKKKFSIG